MIDWNKYQAEALTTAVYPLERELDYTILGLCSEVAEVAELAYQLDEDTSIPDWQASMKSELGDVAWYAAAVADALSVPLQQIADMRAATVEDTSALKALLALVAASGALAGLLKKSIRDEGGHLSATCEYRMKVEVERVLLLLAQLCRGHHLTLEGVTQANLNKLADRKQRDMLGGSGDRR